MASDLEFRRLLYKLARAYYDDGLTQQQIGERFGLSRIRVSRLLRAARDERIVQIAVTPPQGSNTEIERRLEEAFGLKEAVVVACSSRDAASIINQLGPVAATCLTRCLQGNEVVAVSWGTAVLSTVNALPAMDLPNVRVVQFLGGLGELEARTHGADLARRMAQTLGAKPRLILAPGIVKDRVVRDALVMDPQVSDTLELAARADVALVGVGALETCATRLTRDNTLMQEEADDLKARGAVGDIALQFFDADGRKVDHPINQRIVGTDLEAIKQIRRVIGVAGGTEKWRAIHAALRGGLINVLVTDDQTAAQLLTGSVPATS